MLSYSPKITIVTVTYNAEKYLERTIRSVIGQDYRNIEYIIIDGASNDGTIDIIKKYERLITYWISEPDSGIYHAMNKGIDVATGNWIQFLNAGDIFVNNQTVRKVSAFLIDENDLVHGLMWRNKTDRKLMAPYCDVSKPLNGCFIWHPTLFTKLSIMKKHKFNTDFKIAGDYDFFLKALKENNTIKFIEIPIVDYLEDGISQQDHLRTEIEAVFAQVKYVDKSNDIFEGKIIHSLFGQIPSSNFKFSMDLNRTMKRAWNLLSGKRFVLYGYGVFGKIIYQQFKHNVIFIVDKNYNDFKDEGIKSVRAVTELEDLPFVFISVLGRESEIFDYLVKDMKMEANKILFIDNETSTFSSPEYWNDRYVNGGNSGAGSYDNLARFKARVINDFMEENNIGSVIEFGCGDGNNLALYNAKNYIGIDVSSRAVEICRQIFNRDASKVFFTLDEFSELNNAYRFSELALSLDVIYHLIEDDVFNAYMNTLFKSGTRYVIIYSSNFDKFQCSHVKHRMFTGWIEKYGHDWRLIRYIKNIYPWDVNRPNDTSFSDFYMYEKTR